MKKIITVCVVSLALAACTTNPKTGESQVSKTAIGAGIGAATGAGIGALAGGKHKGKAALIGAAAGTVVGAGIGYYMDSQEEELKTSLQGTEVQVQRQGEDLNLVMPGNVAFATGSANISSSFYPALNSVATVLNKSPETTITISGHTDSKGNPDANQQLSKNRADSVARYLVNKGINAQRIQTNGFGDRNPIASNDTEDGRSKNLRVENKIHPNLQ
jgi:outer membrane protein OmpA-like peptidoglycan-associated protein